MDWIEEQLVRLKNRLRMKSLRSVLGIYILFAIVIVITLYILTYIYCNSWRNIIYEKYMVDTREVISLVHLADAEAGDVAGLRIINGILTYSIVLYSITAIVVTTNLFYKNKIQYPVGVLKKEAAFISRNDLSESCRYQSGDELGEVCEAFEKMRRYLIRNNENMWSLMEGQRLLNSTFAHDIRTPLTVIQGYTDMLIRYYPKGKISEEKLLDTMSLMQEQIVRLRGFSETMKNLQDIESLMIKPEENEFSIFVEQLRKTIEGLAQHHNIRMVIHNKIDTSNRNIRKGYFDMPVVLEVVDNLLSNACSFSKEVIEITIEIENNYLNIYVYDDGNGFSKQELYKALNPYYGSRNQINGHFGIGLTICKILCEKHGGKITLSNSIKNGAIVCASFRVV